MAEYGSMHSRQRGFTLIEALVVLMIGVVILAASAAGIGKLFRNSEISTEASNILLIQDRVKDLSNGKEGFTGITNKLAIQNKAFPADMAQSGDDVFNVWNGKVVIGSTDKGKNFFIDYYKVPAEACQRLALRLGKSGWTRLQINEQVIPTNITLTDLGKRCDAGGSNGNKLAFVGGTT